MYEIRIYNPDELEALDPDIRSDVEDKIQEVAETRNPNEHYTTEKLHSSKDLYKLPVKSQHRAIIGLIKPYLIVFRVKAREDSDVYANIDHLEDMYEKAEQEIKTLLA